MAWVRNPYEPVRAVTLDVVDGRVQNPIANTEKRKHWAAHLYVDQGILRRDMISHIADKHCPIQKIYPGMFVEFASESNGDNPLKTRRVYLILAVSEHYVTAIRTTHGCVDKLDKIPAIRLVMAMAMANHLSHFDIGDADDSKIVETFNFGL